MIELTCDERERDKRWDCQFPKRPRERVCCVRIKQKKTKQQKKMREILASRDFVNKLYKKEKRKKREKRKRKISDTYTYTNTLTCILYLLIHI